MNEDSKSLPRRRARIEADLPHGKLLMIDQLVQRRRFRSRAEVVRAALDELIASEFESIKAGESKRPSDRGQLTPLINPDPDEGLPAEYL